MEKAALTEKSIALEGKIDEIVEIIKNWRSYTWERRGKKLKTKAAKIYKSAKSENKICKRQSV